MPETTRSTAPMETIALRRRWQRLSRGDTGNDVVLGGAGVERIYGGRETDVVIGGTGKDNLSGEIGDDLLDRRLHRVRQRPRQARAISAAWSAGYALRHARPDDDGCAVHWRICPRKRTQRYIRPQAAAILSDDQVSDSLIGGSEQDWFLETGYMPMYLPSDVVSPQQVDLAIGDNLIQCGDQVMNLTNQVPSLEGFTLFDSLDTLSDRQTSETLTSLVPKADNMSLEKEHLALMQLVRYDQVTNYAIRSGNWSDPTIWHGGVVPGSGRVC